MIYFQQPVTESAESGGRKRKLHADVSHLEPYLPKWINHCGGQNVRELF